MTVFSRILAQRSTAVFATAFTLACASTPSPGGVSNVPVVRADTVSPVPQPSGTPPAGALPLNHSAGSFSYDLSQTTVIVVGSDSLGSIQDTLLTAATLRYSIQRPNDTLRIVGTVDSLSVSSARDTTGPRVLLAPVTIQLVPPAVDSQPSLVTDSITGVPVGCDSMEDAARAIAHDILPELPPDVRSRQQWSDSSSRTVCRGGIPMTAVMVSTFNVQDVQPRGDSLILQIIRQSTLTLSGAGTQGVRRISVSGTGTSETRFTYELRGGVFLESDGQSMLQLRFDTIQQTEQVTQHSVSRVRRRVEGSL